MITCNWFVASFQINIVQIEVAIVLDIRYADVMN